MQHTRRLSRNAGSHALAVTTAIAFGAAVPLGGGGSLAGPARPLTTASRDAALDTTTAQWRGGTLSTTAGQQHGALQGAQADGGMRIGDFTAIAGQQTPVPIQLTAPRAELRGATVEFFGLDDTMSLSAGTRQADHWVVSMNDLPSLTLAAPKGRSADLSLFVALVHGDGKRVVQRIVTVAFKPDGAAPPGASGTVTAALPPAASDVGVGESIGRVAPGVGLSGITEQEEKTLLGSGLTLMRQGHVSAARLVFEELFKANSAIGTFALAQTYDPVFLRQPMISAIKPDMAEARRLYEKAAQLGNRDAANRLAELNR